MASNSEETANGRTSEGQDPEIDQYDEYIARRRILLDGAKENQSAFDRNVLTLSSAAIGLSLVFLQRCDAHFESRHVVVLYASWIAFTLCIVITLIAFLVAVKAWENEIERWDRAYEEGLPDTGWQDSFLSRLVPRLNYANATLFVIGVVFLCWYVALTLKFQP